VISPDGSDLLSEQQIGGSNVYSIAAQNEGLFSNVFTVAGGPNIQNPSIWSGDGRFVAIVTSSAISSLDGNRANDIYLIDLVGSTQILVSVDYGHDGSGNAVSDCPTISWDGRYVVFRSFSTNIVPGHTNAPDLYLYDRLAGTNCLLTLSQPSADWLRRPITAAISMDDSTAIFESLSAGLGIGHVSGLPDVFAALLPQAATGDSDNDGIPDWWTVTYFGHLTGQSYDQSLAQNDPNGTGMTTLQDYIAGTDPDNPNSTFAASIATGTTNGVVTLMWVAAPGRTYFVEYKNSLTDETWQAAVDSPVISGNQGQFVITTDQSNRFYRLVVQ
jgi:hypothetical protein